MTGVDQVDVVLANNDRVTLRVGETFLKVDANHERSVKEAHAITLAPVATPEILWHKPPVLALAALPGLTLGRLGEPATASPAAWEAVGKTLRALHDAPLPPWPGKTVDMLASRLANECDWLITSAVLPTDVISRNRHRAERVLRAWIPAFIHGDLHLEHVFVDGDEVAGIIDWSEASQGDPLFDIASLTLGKGDRLDDLLTGYGDEIDRNMIQAWWSYRCLVVVRWLIENGYGSTDDLPEVALLHSMG